MEYEGLLIMDIPLRHAGHDFGATGWSDGVLASGS
jgi:hypothetical protein